MLTNTHYSDGACFCFSNVVKKNLIYFGLEEK